MEAYNLLYFAGTVCTLVLAILFLILGVPRYNKLFLVAGPNAMCWCSLVLFSVFASRILQYLNILDADETRVLNSTVFVFSVIGIIVSTYRNGRKSD